MRVLLVSTYELGHQPRCLDLSVERWDAGALARYPAA